MANKINNIDITNKYYAKVGVTYDNIKEKKDSTNINNIYKYNEEELIKLVKKGSNKELIA